MSKTEYMKTTIILLVFSVLLVIGVDFGLHCGFLLGEMAMDPNPNFLDMIQHWMMMGGLV